MYICYALKINFIQLIYIVRTTMDRLDFHVSFNKKVVFFFFIIYEYSFKRRCWNRPRYDWDVDANEGRDEKKIRPPISTTYPIPPPSKFGSKDATLRRNLLIGYRWTSCKHDHEKAINEEEGRSSFNFGLRAYENEARQEAASLDNI